MLIPKLFEAIRLGNVKSECVLGDRIIGNRQVRLKLVAEVVDPGSNPLATHSQRNSTQPLRAVNTEVSTKDLFNSKNQTTNEDRKVPQKKARKSAQQEAQKEKNTYAPTKTGATASKAARKKTRRAPRRKHPMSR